MSSLATYTRPCLRRPDAGLESSGPPVAAFHRTVPAAHVDGIEVPVAAADHGRALMDQRRIPDRGAGLDRPCQLAVVRRSPRRSCRRCRRRRPCRRRRRRCAGSPRRHGRPTRPCPCRQSIAWSVPRIVPTNTLPVGDDRLHAGHQALVGEEPVPLALEGRPNLRRRRPRAGRIVRQHRPVATGRDCSVDQRRDASRRNDNGKKHESRTCTHGSHLTDWLDRTTE